MVDKARYTVPASSRAVLTGRAARLDLLLPVVINRVTVVAEMYCIDTTIRLYFSLSRITSAAVLMSILVAFRSSSIFSIHVFGCRPLLLLPLMLQCIGNLLAPILVACPNHLDLSLWILSHAVSVCKSRLLISPFPSLCSLQGRSRLLKSGPAM